MHLMERNATRASTRGHIPLSWHRLVSPIHKQSSLGSAPLHGDWAHSGAENEHKSDKRAMKITHKNMEAFRARRNESFRLSTAGIIKQHYGQHPAVQTDEERFRFIEAGILKANQYEVPIGPDTAKLIFLMLELSPSFDEGPRWQWARAILETRVDNRMDRLVSAALLVLEDKPVPLDRQP